MAFTTVPTILITLIVFGVLSIGIKSEGVADIDFILDTIDKTVNITPWLFLVPIGVIILILLKTKPLIALGSGVLLACIFAFIFQPNILDQLSSSKIKTTSNSIFTSTKIDVSNDEQIANFNESELLKISEYSTLGALFNDDDLEESFTNEELSTIFSGSYNDPIIKNKVDNLQRFITLKKV